MTPEFLRSRKAEEATEATSPLAPGRSITASSLAADEMVMDILVPDPHRAREHIQFIHLLFLIDNMIRCRKQCISKYLACYHCDQHSL